MDTQRFPAEPGTVYLVGAGHGDPGLITVRGQALLRQADVVVYDRLIHADLLALCRPGAERYYVGKAPGRHSCAQEEIHAVLVDRARAGLVVVRLKGGDPFVFGRGGEEGLALAAAGLPFEVIPGISSAIGVPACAGIPVTHRGLARAFAVVTGHACAAEASDEDGPGGDGPDWAALARIDTLVILMGLRNLPGLAQQLIEHGRAPETPAAVVSRGGTEEQVVATGTLATIGQAAAGLPSPATIVVGEVVRLHEQLTRPAAPGPALPTGFPATRPPTPVPAFPRPVPLITGVAV